MSVVNYFVRKCAVDRGKFIPTSSSSFMSDDLGSSNNRAEAASKKEQSKVTYIIGNRTQRNGNANSIVIV